MKNVVIVILVAVVAWFAYRYWQRRKLRQAAAAQGVAAGPADATGTPATGGGGIAVGSADQAAPQAGDNLYTDGPYLYGGGDAGPMLGGGKTTSMFVGQTSRFQTALTSARDLVPRFIIPPRPGTQRRLSMMGIRGGAV